jgi:hypothetical protein
MFQRFEILGVSDFRVGKILRQHCNMYELKLHIIPNEYTKFASNLPISCYVSVAEQLFLLPVSKSLRNISWSKVTNFKRPCFIGSTNKFEGGTNRHTLHPYTVLCSQFLNRICCFSERIKRLKTTLMVVYSRVWIRSHVIHIHIIIIKWMHSLWTNVSVKLD